jgi:hypothetical protein
VGRYQIRSAWCRIYLGAEGLDRFEPSSVRRSAGREGSPDGSSTIGAMESERLPVECRSDVGREAGLSESQQVIPEEAVAPSPQGPPSGPQQHFDRD